MVLGQARITDEGVVQLKTRIGSYFKGEYIFAHNHMMTGGGIANWCDGITIGLSASEDILPPRFPAKTISFVQGTIKGCASDKFMSSITAPTDSAYCHQNRSGLHQTRDRLSANLYRTSNSTPHPSLQFTSL